MLEREEKCIFKMYFDKKKYDELKKEVNNLKEIDFEVSDGDTLEITYNLNIEYYNCLKQLESILKIAERYGRDIIKISTEELEYGECLIEKIFIIFHEIRKRLEIKDGK